MTVKEQLVGIVQEETGCSFIVACEQVTQYLREFKASGDKRAFVNIGKRRVLIVRL